MTSRKFIHELKDRSRKRKRPAFFKKLGNIMGIGTIVGGAIAGTGIAISIPWLGIVGAIFTIIGATGKGISALAVDFNAEEKMLREKAIVDLMKADEADRMYDLPPEIAELEDVKPVAKPSVKLKESAADKAHRLLLEELIKNKADKIKKDKK